MGLFGKLFKKKIELEQQPKNLPDSFEETERILSIEESKRQLAEIKERVENVKKQRLEIEEQLKIKKAAEYAIPMANYRLDELRKYNHTLETAKLPEILDSCKENIKLLLEWFVLQENEYPNAPWLMVGGANNILKQAENRYNEMLYKLAKESFDEYKIRMSELVTEEIKTEHTEVLFYTIDNLRGFVDTKAENCQECFNSLNEIHYQVEEIFSNSN